MLEPVPSGFLVNPVPPEAEAEPPGPGLFSRWFDYLKRHSQPDSEFSTYHHKKPISVERFQQLVEKMKQGKYTNKEEELVKEYLRTNVYRQRLQEIQVNHLDPKVLYLASGFDGIPAAVFGQHNIIMTSLQDAHYFSSQNQNEYGFRGSHKVFADMLNAPFASHSFSTILVTAADFLGYIDVQKGETEAVVKQRLLTMFKEVARLLKVDGEMLMTDMQQLEKYNLTDLESLAKSAGLQLKVDSLIAGSSLEGVAINKTGSRSKSRLGIPDRVFRLTPIPPNER